MVSFVALDRKPKYIVHTLVYKYEGSLPNLLICGHHYLYPLCVYIHWHIMHELLA